MSSARLTYKNSRMCTFVYPRYTNVHILPNVPEGLDLSNFTIDFERIIDLRERDRPTGDFFQSF
jgi:hypothetical protein